MAEEQKQPEQKPPAVIQGGALLPCMICSMEENHRLLIEQGQADLTVTTRCVRCDTEMTHPFVAVLSGYIKSKKKAR